MSDSTRLGLMNLEILSVLINALVYLLWFVFYLLILCFTSHRPFEVVTPVSEPVVEEVTVVLREWGVLWKELYLVGSA